MSLLPLLHRAHGRDQSREETNGNQPAALQLDNFSDFIHGLPSCGEGLLLQTTFAGTPITVTLEGTS